MHAVKRPDIQVLRAIAVLSVIIYHVRASVLPGGFVGVDVFFVISGFLITGSLLAEAGRADRISLPAFWARRVRRLLPAATVVLVAVLIATAVLLPLEQWPNVISQVAASAVSAENWVLAAQSVDYLQSTSVPTPVQHFWSLSVEEQFYVVWPVLIMLGIVLARRLRRQPIDVWRRTVLVMMVAFFAWGVAETWLSPSTAYFSTATRAWELLAGACLAIWPVRGLKPLAGSAAVLGGFVMIVTGAFVITASTPFPGVAALLPVLGAALMIAGGASTGNRLSAVLRWRPLVWVGDISYSLYLWHWPVIVFLLTFLPGETRLTVVLGVAAIMLSFGLAALSTRFVERPFQRSSGRWAPWSIRRSILLGGALLAITGVFVGGSVANFARASEDLRAATDPRNYPGARVLDPEFDAAQWNDVVVPPIPNAVDLLDIERQLTPDCMTLVADTQITTCEGGDLDSDTTVVLVGDSHAAQWLPAVEAVADEQGWHVILAGKQYCTMTAQQRLLSIDVRDYNYGECADWNRAIARWLLELHPDLVLQGALSYGYPEWLDEPHEQYDMEMASGYVEAWQPLLDAGIPVAAIHEVPRFEQPVPQCLAAHGATIEGCSEPLGTLIEGKPSWLELAASTEPRVPVLDLTPGICPDGMCLAALGNVMTYRDDSHISAPYSASLGWMLEERLRSALPELMKQR